MTAPPHPPCHEHRRAGLRHRLLVPFTPVPGVVTGRDWRRPDLRERYGAQWVPALLARIRASER